MNIGFWELVLIAVIVILVFGSGGRISKIMGDVGKGIRNLKDGLSGETEAEASTKAPTQKRISPSTVKTTRKKSAASTKK